MKIYVYEQCHTTLQITPYLNFENTVIQPHLTTMDISEHKFRISQYFR